jgi:hypothetical protein
MKVQPTTRELIEMLYERLPALFDRAAPVEPDYKQLYEQVCEQYDILAKELEATNRQVEILSDALAESRRGVDALVALARADEREKAKHNEEVLMNALWKACGDDGQMVVETIESQGELK